MNENLTIELLKNLTSIRTVSSDYQACLNALQLIANLLTRNKIPTRIINGNESPVLISGKRSAKILLLGHIDVVSADEDDFALLITEKTLHGRGVLDMKGPLSVMISTFISLWNKGNSNLFLTITSDEEIGGFKGFKIIQKHLPKKIKICILPDTNTDNIIINQKAPLHIQIECRGISAHASRPWEGKNSSELLIQCCTDLINEINDTDKEKTTATITQFNSGDSINVVPDRAAAIIDIRIHSKKELKIILSKIKTITEKYTCLWKALDKPLFFEMDEKNSFISSWAEVGKQLANQTPQFQTEAGTSDARFLQTLKIPTIVTGAIGGGAHSKNEWVSIESLVKFQQKLLTFCIKESEII
ncbi:MAG TPA: M20 family metallopeptidase [Candidatus Levybacteria bacterium]|nr:M20 family metallopeptidase [Candidatus Levybacteria bacterium]